MKSRFTRLIPLGIIILALILYLFPVPTIQARVITRAGALVLFAIGFWATGGLPEHLTALIFLLGAMISRVAPAQVVFSGFHAKALWLVFAGLILGVAIKKTQLGHRLARWLLDAFGHSYFGVLAGIVLVGMLFAFFIPATTGRVVLLIPVVLSMADRLGLSEGTRGRKGMVMAATMACFAPSCGILPANVPNMVLAGASESLYGITFGYADYLKWQYPVIGLLKGIGIVLLTYLLFPDRIHPTASSSHKGFEPFGREDGLLAFILTGTLLLWGTDFLHGISPAWIALAASVVTLMPFLRLFPGGSFGREIDLAPFFYVAGILGVGAVVADTGLGDVLGRVLLKVFHFAPDHDIKNFSLLIILHMIITLLTTVAGLPAVMGPLSADIAQKTGFPLFTVLMSQVIGYSNILLPYQVPPVVLGMQLGGVSTREGTRLTIALSVFSLIILLPANYLWWSLLGAFK